MKRREEGAALGPVGVWKFSRWDVVPFLLTMGQLLALVGIAWQWPSIPGLYKAILWPPLLFLFWYNPIISTHNFIHHPWFCWAWMNRLYSALNSISLGVPQILYAHQHMNHHRFENDRKNAQGRTNDLSSSYARGKNGGHEHVIPYSLFGVFRNGGLSSVGQAWKRRNRGQFLFETLVLLLGLGLMGWPSPTFLFYYFSLFVAGWFLANMENYYEHYHAIPEIEAANSVSYYGKIYNRLFLNEGYHQEHHLRPQTHWSERPRVREELADALAHPRRRVSKHPPLLGFLDRNPIEHKG